MTAWNEKHSVEVVAMTKAHLEWLTFQAFKIQIEKFPEGSPLRGHLTNLLNLYGAHEVLENPTSLFESGYITPKSLTALKAFYKETLTLIRPQALNLVEAFDHHDNVLNSTIGNYYGDIYET